VADVLTIVVGVVVVAESEALLHATIPIRKGTSKNVLFTVSFCQPTLPYLCAEAGIRT
jgi:hypothetical protein